MKNKHSRLEERLARLLGSSPPLPVPASPSEARLDIVYLSDDDEARLRRLVR